MPAMSNARIWASHELAGVENLSRGLTPFHCKVEVSSEIRPAEPAEGWNPRPPATRLMHGLVGY